MSRAWSWRNAILKSKLPATTKHVLMVISCHMNDMGEGCYPSTKRIAEYASLSERSVCTHIEDAGKAGWLEVKTHGYSGQGWARHEYLPLWPEGTELASAPPAERTEPRARGTEPDDNKALKEVQRNISGEQLTEQHIGRPRFDFFWDLYPRKVSRPHAEKAWRSVDGDRKYAEIMAGLRRWVNSADWKERPADKLPYPATWLNGERWNDLPSVVVKPLCEG
jgi:Helix-turn-helix domain